MRRRLCARRRVPPWLRPWTSAGTRRRSMPRAAPRAASWRRRGSRWRRWSAPSRATWCSPPAAPRPMRWRSAWSSTAAPAAMSRWPRHRAPLRAGGRGDTAVERFGAGRDGVVDQRFAGALSAATAQRRAKSPLVSLMLANNETGVIQPVARGGRHGARGGRSAACRCGAGAWPDSLDFKALGADLMTLSAHKIGGPRASAR